MKEGHTRNIFQKIKNSIRGGKANIGIVRVVGSYGGHSFNSQFIELASGDVLEPNPL